MEDENLDDNQDDTNLDNSKSDVKAETPNKDNSLGDDESYKKRYTDSSKEARKLADTHNAYRKVLQDNSYLLELGEDLGKDVVKQLHEDGYADTNSYKDLVKIIKGEDTTDDDEFETIDKEQLVKDIRTSILAEQQEEKSKEILEKSLSRFDSEVRDKYLKEFNETIGNRKLTPEFTKKEIDKIIIYNGRNKSKQEKNDELLGSLASNNLGATKTTTKTSMTIDKLDRMGMPKNRQKQLYPDLYPNKK